MSWSVLGSFALSSLILALAPGPDNIFVLTQSALYGVKKGILVIVGLCLGILVQTLCVIVGVTAFISAVPILLSLIKFLGAAYLLYLAFMAIKHARAVATINLEAGGLKPEQLTAVRLIRRGLIMNVTNPKVQLFFPAISAPRHLRLAFDGLYGATRCDLCARHRQRILRDCRVFRQLKGQV